MAKVVTPPARPARPAPKPSPTQKVAAKPAPERTVPAKPEGLWPIALPIIGGTGENWSGKTTFGLTIAPPEDTCCYDFEKSSFSYHSDDFNFTYIDAIEEMEKAGLDWSSPVERYLWWKGDVMNRLNERHYKVICIDPVSELEDGLAELVRTQPKDFGLTPKQIERSAGLLWGAVKNEWKSVLAKIAGKCDTLYYTVHMKAEWSGNAPTGKRIPKGKSTLYELASLFLEFQRKPAGGKMAAAPSAMVRKDRLSRTRWINGKPVVAPVLPPRLPIATPEAIREYMRKPLDWDKLTAAEQVGEEVFTEREAKMMDLALAERKESIIGLEIEKVKAEKELEERRAKLRAKNLRAAEQVIEDAEEVVEEAAEVVVEEAAEVVEEAAEVAEEIAEEVAEEATEEVVEEEATEEVVEEEAVEEETTEEYAEESSEDAVIEQAEAAEAEAEEASDVVTEDQLDRIVELREELLNRTEETGYTKADYAKWLKDQRLKTITTATSDQADALIETLTEILDMANAAKRPTKPRR